MVSLHVEKGRCGLKFRSLVASFIVVLLSHLTLATVPHLFRSITVTTMVPIAAAVMVSTYALAGWFRRLLGITASAPAVVAGHVMFLFGVHLTINRKALLDAFLELECILILIGLYRFVYGDPGLAIESSHNAVLGVTSNPELELKFKSSLLLSRVRHCNSCNRSVKGFDHHCPAFGNCVGQKNHRLFMVLITLLITTEAMYAVRASQYITLNAARVKYKRNLSVNLVISTFLFSMLQVLWQVPFLTWHMYCICCNIRTEEWVNWKNYPEFRLVTQPQQASTVTETTFTNPYDKGIVNNIREFLTPGLVKGHLGVV